MTKKKFLYNCILNSLVLYQMNTAIDRRVVPFLRQKPTNTLITEQLPVWMHRLASENAHLHQRSTVQVITNTSFKPDAIGSSLFGTDDTCPQIIRVSGSNAHREPDDWLADYFGLPTDFESSISIRPRVTNVITHINANISLDRTHDRWYLDINVPLVFSSWDMNLWEHVHNSGTQNYAPGYVNATGVPEQNLVHLFSEFITGLSAPNIDDACFIPLMHAKFGCKPLHVTTWTVFEAAIGWHCIAHEHGDLTLQTGFTFPLDNKPMGIFAFEPVPGNGHHIQYNAQLLARGRVWESTDTCHSIDIYSVIQASHFFSAEHIRTFDLKNKPNSRYMLAQKFNPYITDNLQGQVNGQLVTPEAQAARCYTPVANLSTIPIDVSIPFQTDMLISLAYNCAHAHHTTSYLFGYGYWAQTREHICPRRAPNLTQEYWTLKGQASAIGFNENTQQPVALSATQSAATIHKGKSTVDNPALAFSQSIPLVTTPMGTQQIFTSIEPVRITPDLLDINGARLSNSSHRFFSNLVCIWHECCWYGYQLIPYTSLGAQVQYGRTPSCTPAHDPASEFTPGTISYWGIWAQIGISF